MVSMDGQVNTNGEVVTSRLNFSIGGDRLSYVTTALEQSFVMVFGDDGSVGIRDCAGDWTCDLDARSCRFSSASGTCEPLYQEINWP